MGFSLSGWLLRKKIGAQIRTSGRPVQHHHVGNPFHAVSIDTGLKCCAEARAIDERRFLAASAPRLPLPGCTMAKCQCRYQHHKDRRNRRDRRVLPHNPHAHKMSDRRSSEGRRLTD
jgi:hypothetical protein